METNSKAFFDLETTVLNLGTVGGISWPRLSSRSLPLEPAVVKNHYLGTQASVTSGLPRLTFLMCPQGRICRLVHKERWIGG